LTDSKTAFVKRLSQDQPLLLDGGIATQLEAQDCDINHVLWSASLLQTNPDAIVTAHEAYLRAGAECIGTASYQASYEGFASLGLSTKQADEMMRLSIRLASNANKAGHAMIAASIGPYGAMLADGSEYRGNYDVDRSTLVGFHQSRLKLFDLSAADVLAVETIPSLEEAEVLAELLAECTTPSWVSFSCKDESNICDGHSIAEAAAIFNNHPKVVAVGINCTPPQYAVSLIKKIRQVLPEKHIIAYPNSGEIYNASTNSWSGTVSPEDCSLAAIEWINAGAKIVGGCCRMGPKHIAAIKTAIAKND
jgi:homocysteine S-methyltransferase